MTIDSQMFYIMLALPALFGMSLLGEGFYKIRRYEGGWINIFLGTVFLVVVVVGYVYFISVR